MPPLAAPAADQKDAATARQRPAARPREAPQRRSASFHHGRGAGEKEEEQQRHLLKQRPRTQPDLLAGVRGRSFRGAADADGAGARPARPAPSKVLVTVAVRQSMWPLHVMARAEWRVADLVAAAVELYVREGRRPLLPSADPSAFGLHYSQFHLQSLDPEEKLMELASTSRSFFLCPKAPATATAAAVADASSSTCSSAEVGKAAAVTKPNTLPPWLRLMHFWPML